MQQIFVFLRKQKQKKMFQLFPNPFVKILIFFFFYSKDSKSNKVEKI